MRNLRNRKAFTLVQLLVVIAILVVVTAIAIPIISGVLSQSDNMERTAWVEELQSAVNLYKTTNVENVNSYPRLGTQGFNEQMALKEGAGNGEIPGYNVDVVGKTAETVYDDIRKQYFTSLKAFTDIEVTSDYYLSDKYTSEDKAFVYYYLTGTVAEVNIADLKFESGAATLQAEEFWVYLSLPDKRPQGHESATG